MRKWLSILLFIPLLAIAGKDVNFNRVVVFGDSLSDTGNLWSTDGHVLPKSPPYFHGHFSNGKMWDERFYAHYFPGRSDFADYNYAVGGAGAYWSLSAPLPYTTNMEITNYFDSHDNHDNTKVLYVLWIGANNYLRLKHYSGSTSTEVVHAIKKQLERLIDHGGNKFLVPGLPLMGITPDARENHKMDILNRMTEEHNQKLEEMLADMRQAHPDFTFVSFDAAGYLRDVLADPEKFGIRHLVDACYTGGYTFKPSNKDMQEYAFANLAQSPIGAGQLSMETVTSNPSLNAALKVGMYYERFGAHELNCDDFLFWDHVHPSTHAHEYLAEYVINTVDKAGLVAVQ